MANVLFTWEMGAGGGHCAKLAPIAERLACAGHRITFAARDLHTARRFFEPLPVTYYQAPLLREKPLNRIHHPRTMAQILHNTRIGDDRHLSMLVRAWRELFESVQPDVIICDYSPTALLASRWHDHFRVVLGTGFELPPALAPLPDIEYWRTDRLDAVSLLETEMAVLDRVNALLLRDKKQPLKCLADTFTDVDLNVLLTFAELDHYPIRERARYWGTWSPGGGCVPKWPRCSGPRIFGYLKPPRSRWELGALLSELRVWPAATLLYVPSADWNWLQQYESPSLHFAQEPVNLREVAQECDAAILNGNAGAVTHFLLHGVPILNIPLQLEQLVTAHRAADLGAGLIGEAPRPQQIADRLNALLTAPKYREAAWAFSKKYSDFCPEETVDQIADKVIDILQRER